MMRADLKEPVLQNPPVGNLNAAAEEQLKCFLWVHSWSWRCFCHPLGSADITVTSDLHMRHRCRLDDHSVMKRWFVWVNRALANKTTFYCRVLQCSKPSSTSTHLAERSAAFWRTECRRRRDTVTRFCHSDWSPPLPLLTLDSPHKQLESLTESLMWKRFEAQREPKLKEEDARREGGRWTEAARWAEPWNTENCCSQENFS